VSWRERATEAVLAAANAARPHAAEAWARPLIEAERILAALSPENLETFLRQAAREAIGTAPRSALELIAAAFGVCLDRPDRERRLADFDPPPRVKRPPLVASHVTPRLHSIDRAQFVAAPSRSTEVAAAVEEEEAPQFETWDDDTSVDPRSMPFPAAPPVTAMRKVELGEGGEPILLSRFYSEVVERGLDTIALRARHRSERRFAEREEEERRILELSDAMAASGHAVVPTVMSWWTEARREPYKTWPLVFTLGSLDGADTLVAVAHAVESLPPTAIRHGELASEAIAVAPHPERRALAEDLLLSPHPLARAMAIDILSRARALPDLDRHLADPAAAVAIAAIRAAARADVTALVPQILKWMRSGDPTVAWEASRALGILGRTDPYEEVQRDPAFADLLGVRLFDLMALFGQAKDIDLLEEMVLRGPVTAGHLLALARFGHPEAGPILLAHLPVPELGAKAADALEILFGARVQERLDVDAWAKAIGALDPDPEVRLRRGEPYSPRLFVAEHARGRWSRITMERWIDELAVRAKIRAEVDLALWSTVTQPQLKVLLDRCEAARFEAGAW
jgi:hypothetical protein